MYQLSELISKPVIGIYDGVIAGTLENVIFDKKLEKIRTFIIYDETSDAKIYLPVSYVVSADKTAIMIKPPPPSALTGNRQPLNPIMSKVYTHDGDLIATLTDIDLAKNFHTRQLMLSDGGAITADRIVSYSGKAVVICYDDEQLKTLIKSRPPRKRAAPKQSASKQSVPVNKKQETPKADTQSRQNESNGAQSIKTQRIGADNASLPKQNIDNSGNTENDSVKQIHKVEKDIIETAQADNQSDNLKEFETLQSQTADAYKEKVQAAQTLPDSEEDDKETNQSDSDVERVENDIFQVDNDINNTASDIDETAIDTDKAQQEDGIKLEDMLGDEGFIDIAKLDLENIINSISVDGGIGKMFVGTVLPPEIMELARNLQTEYEDIVTPDFADGEGSEQGGEGQEMSDDQSRQINELILDKIFSMFPGGGEKSPQQDVDNVVEQDDEPEEMESQEEELQEEEPQELELQKVEVQELELQEELQEEELQEEELQEEELQEEELQEIVEDSSIDYNDITKVYPRHIVPVPNNLLGRKVFKDIYDKSGNIIVFAGEEITEEIVENCRHHGKVVLLARYSSERSKSK